MGFARADAPFRGLEHIRRSSGLIAGNGMGRSEIRACASRGRAMAWRPSEAYRLAARRFGVTSMMRLVALW